MSLQTLGVCSIYKSKKVCFSFVLNFTMKKINKIVLAYSGGLDTSAMLLWLKETYDCEVICYTADVGQGEELSGLDEKAKATGASKLYVEDLREEFVKDFGWMAVTPHDLY